jgi:hypothetical protein
VTKTDYSEPGEVRRYVFTSTRGLRYAELAIVGTELVSFYNSIGLSEAPPDLWDALDADATAKRLEVPMVIKNGPHWWASDRLTLEFGVEVLKVGGMGFRWASNISVEIVKSGGLAAGKYYDPVQAAKRGELVYSAGKPVYELDSPDGATYVMQSANTEIDGFETLGERLTPADGWSYRARTLDEDLTYVMDGAVQTVMDDLRNVYNLVPS